MGPREGGGPALDKLKRAAPWLISLAIVAWLFSSVDLDAVADAVAKADLAALFGWILTFTVLVFFCDAGTLWMLLRRFLGPLSYRDALSMKGVSYFLNAITYSAAAGGIAWFAHRRQRVPFLQALSTLVWLNFVDIIGLLLLMTGGVLLGGHHLPAGMLSKTPWVLAGGWAIVVGALLYWELGWDFLVLGRLRDWRIWRAFRDARAGDYLAMVGVRTAFVSLYVFMAWVCLPTFDVPIELGAMFVYVPILTFVQIIPATVSGLGAGQAVMILLYARHVPAHIPDADAQILAFTTVIGPGTALLRLVLGWLVMARISGDLIPGQEELEAAYSEAEGTGSESSGEASGSDASGGSGEGEGSGSSGTSVT